MGLPEGLKLTELQGQQPHTALTATQSSQSSPCRDPQPGVGLVVAHNEPSKASTANRSLRVAMRILPTNK